jgi:uncharacterized membrane protein YsdA (DUF1294 family)
MLLPIYSVILVILSVITYALYAGDKKKAKKGKWRTPEATLLGFSFFGGAIGGSLAMHTLRHKTKHWYFRAVNLLGVLWQVALLVYLLVTEL